MSTQQVDVSPVEPLVDVCLHALIRLRFLVLHLFSLGGHHIRRALIRVVVFSLNDEDVFGLLFAFFFAHAIAHLVVKLLWLVPILVGNEDSVEFLRLRVVGEVSVELGWSGLD